MITVDTRGEKKYHPLIPAMEAICLSAAGRQMQIIMDNKEAFDNLKEYLSEHNVGFREIYDQDYMTLQFTTNKR
ncbi:sulfurtransferase TusA family protein [Bacteroides sp. 51]|uniref:sulfurtransferase TusA family protein n=1 Tax=Bacteroides sp. 51 TaxID=2302938 RepID=UPI0013D51D3F|nr:sulfurtransferase TusA family protein [Bacteroides sp. 51]NDV81386.1 sulfurtransferase TusA family protein [Bacteroides sp. 51]